MSSSADNDIISLNFRFRNAENKNIFVRWILLDGIRTLPYGHWRIGLYKRLIASEISPEEAEERAMKAKLRVKA
jgi:hypothetical protein